MQEALALLRGLREHIVRQTGHEVREGADGVDHHAFRGTRMRVATAEGDRGEPRAPRLVADLAELTAVDGIGELRAECADIELVDAEADLLVGGEADFDPAMNDLRILPDRN